MQRLDEVMFDLEEFVGGDDGRWMGRRTRGPRLARRAHQRSLWRRRQRRSRLGLAPVRQIETNAGYDAAVGHFAATRVLHDVHAKLNDVARANLSWRTLFRTLAQTLVVHERTITAFRILRRKIANGVIDQRVNY